MRSRQGLIQVYTGNGKGKTTAALGLALRAVGCGMKVLMVQFLKSSSHCNEIKAAQRLSPHLEIVQKGRPQGANRWEFTDPQRITAEDKRAATEALDFCRERIGSGQYDVVILDEILCAVSFGLIPIDQAVALIDNKPPGVEVILTGRNAPKEILERADLITEMRCLKHPFENGIPAREGIEF